MGSAKMTKSSASPVIRAMVLWAMGAGLPAWAAVNDLPGGPAVNQLNLHPPVSQIAEQQQWLHWVMLIICVVIFVGVFGVMFYSILKHRKSVGHKAAHFHESLGVEIAWTVVPFIIVIGMGAMATRTVVAMKDTTNADLTIKATGYQWRWGYDYLKGEGEGIGFLSSLDAAQRQMSDAGTPSGDDYLLKVDNPLVVPVDKKVRIVTTANDVIHAFMVPALGVKQDAIPGFVRDTWFRANQTGDFYGQCAELCGKEHAYMPIHVKVLSQADYSAWVEGKLKAMAALADDPSQGVGAGRTGRAWREGLPGELPGLPPGQRQGRRADQAAGRQPDRAQRAGNADQHPAERPQQWRHAGLEAALGHRDRRRHHLHQEFVEQPDRQARAACRDRGRPQVIDFAPRRSS